MRSISLSLYRSTMRQYSGTDIYRSRRTDKGTKGDNSQNLNISKYSVPSKAGGSNSFHEQWLKTIRDNHLNQYYNRAGKTPYSYMNNTKYNNKTNANKDVNGIKDQGQLNLDNGQINFKSKSGKLIKINYKDGEINRVDKTQNLTTEEIKEIGNVEKFIMYLTNDPTGNHVKGNFSKEDIKNIISNMGLKPGFINIKSKGNDNKFCVLDDGQLFSQTQVEAERGFYNKTNLIKYEGYSKNAFCVIDGNRYDINSYGHFNIPKGVRCLTQNMKIVK